LAGRHAGEEKALLAIFGMRWIDSFDRERIGKRFGRCFEVNTVLTVVAALPSSHSKARSP
jgi:hypothetical protein